MKKFIITILITSQVVCSFAQKYASIDSVPGAPVFSYTHNTAMEIVKDKNFILSNAKVFLDFFNKALDQNLLEDSAKSLWLLESLEEANIILGNYKAAENVSAHYLSKDKSLFLGDLPDKVFLDVKAGNELSYSAALANELKHADRKSLEHYERYYGYNLYSLTAFAFLSSDTANYRKSFERFVSPDITKDKKLSMTQFSDFILVYCENIVADAVIKDFLKVTSPFNIQKWNKVWNNKLYHFTDKDSLHDILACNYQVFNRNFFDPKILWRNPGEIPGNHIDDDSNGIVDDVNGYEYNMNNQSIKEPVALSWKETDSVAAVKHAFRYPPEYRGASGVHQALLVSLIMEAWL